MRPWPLLLLLLSLLPLPAAVAEIIIGGGIDAEIYPADSYWEPILGLSFQLGEYFPVGRDAGIYVDGAAEVNLNPLNGEIGGKYHLDGDISLLARELYIRWLIGSLGSFSFESEHLGFDTSIFLSVGNAEASFYLDPHLWVGFLPVKAFGTTGDIGLSWSAWQKLLVDLTLPFKMLRKQDADREAALGAILRLSYYPPAPWVLDGEWGIRRETSTELGAVDTVTGLPVGSFWELVWGLDISLAAFRSSVFALTLPGYLRRKDHGPVVDGLLQSDRNQWDLQLEPRLKMGFHPAEKIGLNVSIAFFLLLSQSPETSIFSTTVSLDLDITV